MSSGPPQNQSFNLGIQQKGFAIPLSNIIKHLSFESSKDNISSKEWELLKIQKPVEAELEPIQNVISQYQLQNNAYALYDSKYDRWTISGDGDDTARVILGIIKSKRHNARAIQLPNQTHKIVQGIINGKVLLNQFSAPVKVGDRNSVILTPRPNAQIYFTRVSPVISTGQVRSHSHSHKTTVPIQYKLYAKNQGLNDINEISRASLSWKNSSHDRIVLHSGSDAEDLAKYRNILLSLRTDFLDDHNNIHIEGAKRQVLEKRLHLLEHEIDGLLKRKINFNSKNQQGPRSLDYTVIIHDKEVQLVKLHQKIHNLQDKLKEDKNTQVALSKQVERLNTVIKSINNPNISKDEISNLLLSQVQAIKLHNQSKKLNQHLQNVNRSIISHFEDLKLKGVKVEGQEALKTLVNPSPQIFDYRLIDGIYQSVNKNEKIIQMHHQDDKTTELIRSLSIQLNRIYLKYPKVKEQSNSQVVELISREVNHTIGIEGLSKIIDIVKYVPEVVRVQNTYTYNTDKQRKVQLHLKALLKALLLQLQTMKQKSGLQPSIDGSVVAMIHDELGDSINIDQILKICQVYHKIVQVPKYIEKIVERVVEVPTVIPIQKIVEKIVYDTRVEEIEKIIHVPIEVVKFVDRIVQKIVEIQVIKDRILQVPRVIQKIVEKRVQVPKIVQVQVFVEKIVELQKPHIVQRIVNNYVQKIVEVEVVKQQTVVVKEIVEVVKIVQKIVEKIVEKIIQKPVIVEVEKIVQKIVHTIEYKSARQVVNHVEHVPQIIQRIIERVIPVIQTVQKIKQVEKIVQKIVQVTVEVPTVKEVKVIQQKLVYKDRVIQIQKINEKIVTLIQQRIKQVQKRVEIPIIQQRIVTVSEIIEKIIPERCEVTKIVQVEKIVEKIVQVCKMIEVSKPVFKYIIQQKPVKVIVEKIVEIPKIHQRIKEVKVVVQKLIEKIVQVPKVVQVEKIVEKIICVPRIVQKIVEVPKIIEVIVEKIIEVQKVIHITKEVYVPVIQQRIVEIEVIKNVEVPVVKVVEIIREKIVKSIEIKQVIKPVDVIKEKVVQSRKQIPKQIFIDKIICQTVEVEKIVQLQKALVVPFEVPVPCDKIVEKLIIVEKICQKPVQVQLLREKIVQVIVQSVIVKEIVKIEERPYVKQTIKQVEKIVPYITQKIRQVEVVKQRPVPVSHRQQVIKQVQAIHQKIVQVNCQVPKIYEIKQITEKLVQVPKFIQITVKQPVLMEKIKIVEKLVDKIVEVHSNYETIKPVQTIQQKIVAVQVIKKEVRQVQVFKDRMINQQRLVNKTDVNNKIQTKIQPIDRIEQKIVPITSSHERIVQVPFLVEKCVQRVILMPQIYEVTKHIVQLNEHQHDLIAVDVDIEKHRQNYRKLYLGLKRDSDQLLTDLRALKASNPAMSARITAIQQYIANLQQLNEFPKIVQVSKDKIVNKQVQVPVFINKRDPEYIKYQAFNLVIIQRLIDQLKNAESKGNYKVNDEQIKYLFFTKPSNEDQVKLKLKLQEYYDSNKDSKVKKDLDSALLSNLLHDKFYLANLLEKSKLENENLRKLSDQRLSLLQQYKQKSDVLHNRIQALRKRLQSLKGNASPKDYDTFIVELDEIDKLITVDIKKIHILDGASQFAQVYGQDVNYKILESKIRSLQAEVQLYKKEYLVKSHGGHHEETERALADKQRVITSLTQTITNLIDKNPNINTKTTINNEVTSLNDLNLTPQKYSNNTSIINNIIMRSGKKQDNRSWNQIPIITEGNNQDHFGYIVLPQGKQKGFNGYRVVENNQNKSITLIPIGDQQRIHKNIGNKSDPKDPTGGAYVPIINPYVEEKGRSDPKKPIGESYVPIINPYVEEKGRSDPKKPIGESYIPIINPYVEEKGRSDPKKPIGESYIPIINPYVEEKGRSDPKKPIGESYIPIINPYVEEKGRSDPKKPIGESYIPIINPYVEEKGRSDPKKPIGESYIPIINPYVEEKGRSDPKKPIGESYIPIINPYVEEKGRSDPKKPIGESYIPIINPYVEEKGRSDPKKPIGESYIPIINPYVEEKGRSDPKKPIGESYIPIINPYVEEKGRSDPKKPIGVVYDPNQISQPIANNMSYAISNSIQQSILHPIGGVIYDPVNNTQTIVQDSAHYINHQVPGTRDINITQSTVIHHQPGQHIEYNQDHNIPNISHHLNITFVQPAFATTPPSNSIPLARSRVILQESPISRQQLLHLVQDYPNNLHLNPNIIMDPSKVVNLPGRRSRIVEVDPLDGSKVQIIQNEGQLQGADGNGGVYITKYHYKQQKKEQLQGDHRVEKTVTEIRTNQTINWISRSRVVDNAQEQQRRKSLSPANKLNDLSPNK